MTAPQSKWLPPALIPTEHAEQCVVVQWAELHERRWPELWMLHAIPNGGARHKAVAGKLKAEGTKAGVPDLDLPVPCGTYHGLRIEMKRTKDSSTSPEQKRWHEGLAGQGYCVRICKGADVAIKEIERYLELGEFHQ